MPSYLVKLDAPVPDRGFGLALCRNLSHFVSYVLGNNRVYVFSYAAH